MISDKPFYHASIRKILVAFGKLFTNIEFERMDNNGIVQQKIKVPVALGNKDKWLTRIKEDPNLSGKTQITLPRMGFELVGFQYDGSRKLPALTQFSKAAASEVGDLFTAYSPVPYNIALNLYVVTKNQGDALQIVEQILPYFTPQYTVTIEMFPEVGIDQDVPFVLQDVSMQDDYEGSFEAKRMVIYTLSFIAKAELIGPARGGGNQILHTRIKVGSLEKLESLHSLDVELDGSITESWTDLE